LEKESVSIFWFRRDLRLVDNAGLYQALKTNTNVLCLFIFDINILSKLEDKTDARVTFIYNEISDLKHQLELMGSTLLVKHGDPEMIWKELINSYYINEAYANHDYEPYAILRDKNILELLNANSINFKTYKDQVIFEKNEIIKNDGSPYTVFTPYSNKWKSSITEHDLKPYPSNKYIENFLKTETLEGITLDQLGFIRSEYSFPGREPDLDVILNYDRQRDFPSMDGTSRLSIHLRFGTISIRDLANKGVSLNIQWMNELIWREFYMSILFHFPHVAVSSFRPAYNNIEWLNQTEMFDKWCNGQTGYPIVDAGMRQLNSTGFMHNRVRMIVASFLTKHLLIDWRWGEAYFATKLLDYELASNNGGWQWAAGSGVDAAPYFRIFNPYLQTKKFDPELKYIRKWVAELDTPDYPLPIIDHDYARKRCIETYKKGLG